MLDRPLWPALLLLLACNSKESPPPVAQAGAGGAVEPGGGGVPSDAAGQPGSGAGEQAGAGGTLSASEGGGGGVPPSGAGAGAEPELGGEGGGTSDGADGQGGDPGGPMLVNGCSSFVDRTAAGASRTLPWDEDLIYVPERCMEIRVGQSVTFSGELANHPMLPSGGDMPSPIGGAVATFTNPGTFGYRCIPHPSEMNGAIRVVP